MRLGGGDAGGYDGPVHQIRYAAGRRDPPHGHGEMVGGLWICPFGTAVDYDASDAF